MLIIGLLLFKTVLLNSAFAVQEIPFARFTWIKALSADREENNRRLLGYAYRTLPTRNIYDCALTCLKDSRCQSYNYFRVRQLCEVNSAKRIDDAADAWIRFEGKWVPTINGLAPWNDTEYHGRESYSFSGNIPLNEGACSPFPCSDDHICSISPGGKGHECIRVRMSREDLLFPWSKWSSWGQCSATCNTGVQTRARTCNSNDQDWLCKGHRSESKVCSGIVCPTWSYWSTWSACSTVTSCGTGTRHRTRTCLFGNRRNCEGVTKETDKCTTTSCEAPIRLTNGINGVVQILDEADPTDLKWRTACRVSSGTRQSSDSTVYKTICQQLALGRPLSTNISDVPGSYTTYISPRHCDKEDKLLMQCSHFGWSLNANYLDEMTICNGSMSLLRCVLGVIDIKSVTAGNTSDQSCPSDPSADTKVVANCTLTDVLRETKYECDGKRICPLKTIKESWNRDCIESVRYLQIKYQCLTKDTGFWSSWSSWTTCAKNNVQTRERKIIRSRSPNEPSTYNDSPVEKRICRSEYADVKYEINKISQKLLILDPTSLTWKYARSESWHQPNSNVACRELNMTTSSDFFVWMGRRYTLMEEVIGSGHRTITADQRCHAINGEIIVIYDYELQDVDNEENDPDSLLLTVISHYGHCLLTSGGRACMYLSSKSYFIFCALPACSNPLGMESGEIKDSDITVSSVHSTSNNTANNYGSKNIRMNWAGLHLQSDGVGWRPDSQDKSPWVVIRFEEMKRLTSIVMKKYASTEESITMMISCSIDSGTIWYFDPTEITIVAGTNYAYKFFERSSKFKSPVANYLRLQSSDVIQFSALKVEIFGCGFDPADDAACDSELGLKQHPLPVNNSKYEIYLQNYSSVDNNILTHYMHDIHEAVAPKYEINWLPSESEYHGCNLSALASGVMSGCHWFEIEFLQKAVITSVKVKGWDKEFLSGHHHTAPSQFMEQTLRASNIQDHKLVCWTKHFLLMYHQDNDWQFYGSDSNFLSGNTDGQSFIAKHLRTTLITKRIRVIPISWNSRPCITMVFNGCYLHELYNFYFNEKSLPFQKERAYSNYKISCTGGETSLHECAFLTDVSSSSQVPVTLVCEKIPDQQGDTDLESWNQNSTEKSKIQVILHENIGTFSETKLIWATEYVTNFASTEDNSKKWCMNVAGDSMMIEFKQAVELHGIKLLNMADKFSRDVLQGFYHVYIKWSLDKVSWVTVKPEMLTFDRYQGVVQITVKQYLHAKYLKVHPVVFDNMLSCWMIEIYGYQSEYNTNKALQECTQPLGMENGNIANEKITASSHFDEHHLPSHGRIGFDNSGTINDGWACSIPGLVGNSWIQIEFPSKYMVTGVITQGSGYIHFVKSYKIAYSDDGSTWSYSLKQDNTHMVFAANTDSSSRVINYLSTPIITSFIRLYPLKFHTHITMRLEVLGCSSNGEMLPESDRNVTKLSLLQSQMQLYKPGNSYEYWNTPSMKLYYSNAYCMMNGGLLASKILLNSTLASEVPTHFAKSYFAVGLTDTSRLEIYEDVDQLITMSSAHWYPREPQPLANEHCLIVRLGFWFDVGCQVSHRGICEKPCSSFKNRYQSRLCASGYYSVTTNSHGENITNCYKVFHFNSTESAAEILKHCSLQGGLIVSNDDEIVVVLQALHIDAKKYFVLRLNETTPHYNNRFDDEKLMYRCLLFNHSDVLLFAENSCSNDFPLYSICKRHSDLPSLLQISERKSKSINENLISSSFTETNPSWMAFPIYCGSWCMLKEDNQRWIQVDLEKLVLVHSVIISSQSHQCSETSNEDIAFASNKFSKDTPRPTRVSLSAEKQIWINVEPLQVELHSDSSYIWMLKRLVVGRFIKVYFKKDHTNSANCATIDITGQERNFSDLGNWKERFIPMQLSGMEVEKILVTKAVDEATCSYKCLDTRINICSLYTFDGENCTLFALEENEPFGQESTTNFFSTQAWFLKEKLFTNVNSPKKTLDEDLSQYLTESYVEYVNGSEILGCYKDDIIKNLVPMYSQDYYTPTECVYLCFALGYENAVLKLGGLCFCGDAISGDRTILTLHSLNIEQFCNIPCRKDPTLSCGGAIYALIYQKPGRCFRGFLAQKDGNYYCFHGTKATYNQAADNCRSLVSHEELASPIESRELYQFIQEWITNVQNSSGYTKNREKVMSIWIGKFNEFIHDDFPSWIILENNYATRNDDSCIYVDLYLRLNASLEYGTVRAADCSAFLANFICELGMCDAYGNCKESSHTKVRKELKQSIEFIVIKEAGTWHESREICLQRGLDLCMADNICNVNFSNVFSSDSFIQTPIRDNFMDFLVINTAARTCSLKSNTSALVTAVSNIQAIFCCGMGKSSEIYNTSYSHASVSSLRRSGLFSLSSIIAAISIVWQEKTGASCCVDCFKIYPNKTLDAQFYVISPGLNDVEGTVSFESVDTPGYFISYCEDSLMLIVEKWMNSDRATFWKRNDNTYEQGCSRYESYEFPSMYIFIDTYKQMLIEKSHHKVWLDSTCIVSNKGFHDMYFKPDRFTWQSAREFCNDRGKDLCSYEKLDSENIINSMWIPVANDENEWGIFLGETSLRHNLHYGVASVWGIQPGICYGWGNADNICPHKDVVCCDAVKYSIKNEEDPPSSFELPINVGDAIEYGCWSNFSLHNLTKFENQNEESCYITCKEQSIYAYGFAEPNFCFGITNDVLTNGTSALKQCNSSDLKVVRISYPEIFGDIRYAMEFQQEPGSEFCSLMVSSENLYSFTQSFWYQDEIGGGAFLYYASSAIVADDVLNANSPDVVLAIFKISERNSFIINICGISLMYDSAITEQHFDWHNLLLTLHEQEGIVVYLDGDVFWEYGGRNVGSDCYIPANGRIQIGTDETEHSLKNMSIVFDMWNYSLSPSQIRNLYSKFSVTGNLISSANKAHFKNSSEQLIGIPRKFLTATKWLQSKSTAFVLSIFDANKNAKREGVVKTSGYGTWVIRTKLASVKQRCFPLTNPLSIDCTPTSEFKYFPVSQSEFTFQFIFSFTQFPKYLQLINTGKGKLALQGTEISAGVNKFSVISERKTLDFKKLKISNVTVPSSSLQFYENDLKLTLTHDRCDNTKTFDRNHSNYSPRICLQNMWHAATTCTVPLFHHGTFLDYLLEKWRAPSYEGGLRAYGIKQLMKFINAKALEPVPTFYHVCHGGYNIRLMRISQKLLSSSNVPPNKSIKSGVLQYYIQGIGWGNVCMKQLSDTTFAQVACRQLGFSGVKLVSYAKLGERTIVSFRNPLCQGDETFLDECAERYDMYCDSTQSVHVTCDIAYENLPDPWIPLTENLFMWNEMLARTENFEASQTLCKHLGGSLPEPTSYEAIQLLIIQMYRFQLENVWLGVRRFEQKMRWMTSGNYVKNNYFFSYTEGDGDCLYMNINGDWTDHECSDAGVGTICVKTTGCPKGFKGVDCEITDCPEQTLYGVQAYCIHNHSNIVVNNWCQYACNGSGKFIGEKVRTCIYDSIHGVMWNQVDPMCDSNTALSAIQMCMKYGACQNGGTCLQVSSNNYSCLCIDGYEGLNCQINNTVSKLLPAKSVNPCHFNFCSNYGTCIAEYKTFRCLCPNGYFGSYCEMLPSSLCNPNPCLNYGSCMLAGHNNFICRCKPGYSGRTCEKSFEDVMELCVFPFQYKDQNFSACTSKDIDIYRDLRCWNDLHYAPTLHTVFKVPQNETNSSDFRHSCYLTIFNSDWNIFATKVSQGNFVCMSAKDAQKQYSRHGYSSDCNEDAMHVYEIVYENVDLTWCSTDEVYSGSYIFCKSTPQTLLLQPNPIVEVIVDHSKQICFNRDSATIGQIQFESQSGVDLLSYISEVLSCAHHGRKQLHAYESPTAFSVADENGTCKFPAFRDGIIHFSCFYMENDDSNRISNVPICYNAADQIRYCLDRYYQERIPCKVSERIQGYRLTTTFGGQSTEHNCVFPFIYNGVEYLNCSLGWCYTDEQRTEESGWKYCYQDQCTVYPRPPTGAEDKYAPEVTEAIQQSSCHDLGNLYFGRQITRYSCEQACSLQSECRGYVFLPENKIFFYSGKVYSIHKDVKSYSQAEQQCKEMGGTLLNLPQSKVYEHLKTVITEQNLAYVSFWIMTVNASSGCYSLQVMPSTTFKSLQWLESSGDCNSRKAYICERDANEETLESVLMGQRIADVGYCIGMRYSVKFNKSDGFLNNLSSVRNQVSLLWGVKKNNCGNYKNTDKSNKKQSRIKPGYHNEPNTGRQFKIFASPVNWTEAEEICQLDGGRLAVVNSYEMEQFLKKQMSANGNVQKAYFGLKDNFLTWVDGSFVRYIKYSQSVVNKGFCMTLSINSNWEPVDCGLKLPFICENYVVKTTVSKDFWKLTNDTKAGFSNGNQTDVVEILKTVDEEICMEKCLEIYNIWRQCRSFLFNDSHCLLLSYDASSANSGIALTSDGEYSYFEITHKDSCYISLLNSLESFLVGVGHDTGSEEIRKSNIVHSTSSKSYCFALAEDGGKLWIEIFLPLISHVTGITADFRMEELVFQDLNTTAQILQSKDKTQWELLLTELNATNIRHFLDRSAMKYIRVTFSYNSFDMSYFFGRLCIKFDVIGCVSTSG